MTAAAARIPRWTVWSVGIGVVAAIAVTLVVGALSADEPLDTTDLSRYLLDDADVPGEFVHAISFDSVESTLDPRSGATAVAGAVFTTDDPDAETAPDAVAAWRPGAQVVVSEVLDFGSNVEAREHLEVIWSDYKLGALERQRGPDGSLVMFHPDFEQRPGLQPAPVAVAAWTVDTTVMTVTFVGAGSSSDALTLARIVETRHTGSRT